MSVLLACLLLAPPAAPSQPAPAAAQSAAPSYAGVQRELEQAIAQALDDPAHARPALKRALAQLDGFRPKLALDPDGLHARDMALLALAHTYQHASDQLAAASAMDEFIRTVADRPFDLRTFGEPIVNLYAARLEALERAGVGSIHAACGDCMLFINEAPVLDPRPRLYLGTYRVWLVSDTRTIAAEVTITRDGEVRYVDLPGETGGPGQPPPPQLVDVPADGFAPAGAGESERLMHPGASVSGTLISAGVMIGGIIMLALEQKCLRDPQTTCAADFTIPIGGVLLGLGAGGFTGFGSVVIIDETRAARRRGR